MTLMFHKAAAFNSDLSKWQTSNVANMHKMFFQAAAFNTDISKWNTEGTELSLMFFGATAFDRTLCGDQWTAPGKAHAKYDVLRDSKGRYGCCEVGSFMSNPYGPFNSTDGGGSCLACPTGWKSMNAILNVNYNCTRCEDGKSSISKTTSCTSCARGRILLTVEPLYWYVILLNVCPFSVSVSVSVKLFANFHIFFTLLYSYALSTARSVQLENIRILCYPILTLMSSAKTVQLVVTLKTREKMKLSMHQKRTV